MIALMMALGLALTAPEQKALLEAWNGIKGDAIAKHIAVLASDEYEGRAPGTAANRAVCLVGGDRRDPALRQPEGEGGAVGAGRARQRLVVQQRRGARAGGVAIEGQPADAHDRLAGQPAVEVGVGACREDGGRREFAILRQTVAVVADLAASPDRVLGAA